MSLTGWPVTVINRGRVVVDGGELHVEPGSGEFLARERSTFATPLGREEPEVDTGLNFGARILARPAGNDDQ